MFLHTEAPTQRHRHNWIQVCATVYVLRWKETVNSQGSHLLLVCVCVCVTVAGAGLQFEDSLTEGDTLSTETLSAVQTHRGVGGVLRRRTLAAISYPQKHICNSAHINT